MGASILSGPPIGSHLCAPRDRNRQGSAKRACGRCDIRIEPTLRHPGWVEADDKKIISLRRLFRHRLRNLDRLCARLDRHIRYVCGFLRAGRARDIGALFDGGSHFHAGRFCGFGAGGRSPQHRCGPPARSGHESSQTRGKPAIRMVACGDQKSLHVGDEAFGFESLPLQPFAFAGPDRRARAPSARSEASRKSSLPRWRRSSNRGLMSAGRSTSRCSRRSPRSTPARSSQSPAPPLSTAGQSRRR